MYSITHVTTQNPDNKHLSTNQVFLFENFVLFALLCNYKKSNELYTSILDKINVLHTNIMHHLCNEYVNDIFLRSRCSPEENYSFLIIIV